MIDHIRRHAFYQQQQNMDEPLGHCPLRRACEDRLDAAENAERCKGCNGQRCFVAAVVVFVAGAVLMVKALMVLNP